MHSLLAAFLAAIVLVAGWYDGTEVMRFIDRFRGLDDSILQVIIREVVIPGVAAYVGSYYASRWVEKSNSWNVFYMLVVALLCAVAYPHQSSWRIAIPRRA